MNEPLSYSQYAATLSRLRGQHHLDWESPAPGTYRQQVGELHLEIVHKDGSPAGAPGASWSLRAKDASSDPVHTGDSDSATLARLELLTYAMQWVRTYVQPLGKLHL